MKALRTLSWALCATALVMFLMAAFPAQKANAWLTYDEFTWARAADSLVTNRFYGRATFSDTLRMRSDTTVALIFLRGRGDSAWAFKARKGTTTWYTLMWGDTVGKVYAGNQFKTADLVFGPSAISSGYQGSSITFGASYLTLDHTGKALYITATGDSGEAGAVAQRDTLKAKVVATTAMSDYNFMPRITGGVLHYQTGFVNSDAASRWGVYSVTSWAEYDIINPNKRMNGARIIMDSVYAFVRLKATTDTMRISFLTQDSSGVLATTVNYADTVIGTGSSVLTRISTPWPVADTANYVTGTVSYAKFVFMATRTDSLFIHRVGYKYHTIP